MLSGDGGDLWGTIWEGEAGFFKESGDGAES